MALIEDQADDLQRRRRVLLSQGHMPPRFIDDYAPTYHTGIHGDGGPSKVGPRSAGTNPWIAGSFTIGSGNVWLLREADFHSSTPNVWFKLRHNHSGTNATNPGGTIRSWHLPTRGDLNRNGEQRGLLSLRSGTVFLYGFGAGSVSGTSSNRVHRALGTRAVDRVSAYVGGVIL